LTGHKIVDVTATERIELTLLATGLIFIVAGAAQARFRFVAHRRAGRRFYWATSIVGIVCFAIGTGRIWPNGVAAAALLGYLRLTGKRIDPVRLLAIAAGLGADVPFFLFGGCALGVGKGEEIYPLPDLAPSTYLIVSPNSIHVPTPDAYRWLHAPELASLTKSAAAHKLYRFCALCWSPREASLSNDFEAAVFRRHARLGQIKRALLRKGASEALLAGSGSAVFGVFPSPAKARRAVVGFPHDQTFVCETVSRPRYARVMNIASVVL